MRLNKDYLAAVELLKSYSQAYYLYQNSPVSDEVYDKLFKEVSLYEAAHPDEVDRSSPTQRVGEIPDGAFKKISHAFRMYSLDKVYDLNELKKFYKRFKEFRQNLSKSAVDHYYCDFKMDGLSCDLVYKDGELIGGITRGDGITGEDVSANVFMIDNIPQRINTKVGGYSTYVYIRGEVVVHRVDFFDINHQREKQGLQPFSNPRNYASGSLRQLDPKITKSRNLKFYGWEVRTKHKEMSVDDQIQFMKMNGFSVPRGTLCDSVDDIIAFVNETGRIREELPYDIDGVVIKQNAADIQRAMGETDRVPRWAIAWKFASTGADTKIVRLIWQVGRTGKLTPVAKLEPVVISGSVIERVSLANVSYVLRSKIGPGAKVHIVKSGDVIPQISKIYDPGTFLEPPTTCPCCCAPLELHGADLVCVNPDCAEQLIAKLKYVVSRDVLDVKGIGEKFIRDAVETKTITSFKDIFTPIESKDRKVSQDLLDALVMKVRRVTYNKLLVLLGIPQVSGIVTMKIVSETGDVDTLKRMLDAGEAGFEHSLIPSRIKQNLLDWYKHQANRDLLKFICESGVL